MLRRPLFLAAVASVLVTSTASHAPAIIENEAPSVQTPSRPARLTLRSPSFGPVAYPAAVTVTVGGAVAPSPAQPRLSPPSPHGPQPRARRVRRQDDLPFSPFSATVSAWNDFETDNFVVYDWVTRVLIPVVKLLPLLVVMLMISQTVVCLSATTDDAGCYLKFDPDLDDIARSVRSAIDRQRAMHEH